MAKTKTTVLLTTPLWKRFLLKMHEARDITSQSRAVEVAMEEWLTHAEVPLLTEPKMANKERMPGSTISSSDLRKAREFVSELAVLLGGVSGGKEQAAHLGNTDRTEVETAIAELEEATARVEASQRSSSEGAKRASKRLGKKVAGAK